MVVLAAERLRTLCWVHAISEPAYKRMLADRQLAHERDESVLAEILIGDDAQEAIADAREIASTRMRLLRVCATLASTLGLLGGILMLAGAELPPQGLAALQAGNLERARMSTAITTMAIGVGSSAFCFQALSILRTAARTLLTQADRAARARGLG
ncbi:MAG TPA: hypothetical protein VFX59_21920 [Polyangiales bacterium]|nr:hypothetical protein [Polyangiales bacterium]